MLYSLELKRITEVPHDKEFKIWKSRLTSQEYCRLIDILTQKIDEDEIHTSSWIPGSDWSDTPYDIIWEKACHKDEQHAAFFFGLILWDAVMRHPDDWCFGKYSQHGVQGTTYFRVTLK